MQLGHCRIRGTSQRALPDRQPELAASLEACAALLRKAGRAREAEALESRARVIHEDEEGQARGTGDLAGYIGTLSERGATQAAAGDLYERGAHLRTRARAREPRRGRRAGAGARDPRALHRTPHAHWPQGRSSRDERAEAPQASVATAQP